MLFAAAIAAAGIYLALLFWLAAWRDRNRAAGWLATPRTTGWVYGLSLAVYCTSWTFFGGVGTAATAGWQFLPIYLGPILVFTLGFGLVRLVLARAKAQHSTSIADFLSARYGKSAWVAALVTVIATVGALPYMALQLQSVGMALVMLAGEETGALARDQIVAAVAVLMAVFAVLFGSRRADRAGDNAGLVLTIAIEAVVKLVALFAVAALAIATLRAQPAASPSPALFALHQLDARFAVLTLLSACAVLCLPRQFHMTFVEATTDRATPAMQWILPAYLVLTALVIIPIVIAGRAVLPAETDADSIVMALPLAGGHTALAMLVFIGGFSAATGMIVVATVALSTMITNDLIAPLVFRRVLLGEAERAGLAQRLLMIRRLVIGLLMILAYQFYASFGLTTNLAGLGTLAFAAAAQFAPGLVLGMISRAGNRAGMIAGLLAGFAGWLGLLIVPAATGRVPLVSIHPDTLVSGVLISLGANLAAYLVGSALFHPRLRDEVQAASFVGSAMPGGALADATSKRVADIRLLLAQFVGTRRADAALEAMPRAYRDADHADPALLAMAERMISGVIGSSSAQMLVSSWAQGDPVPLAEVVAMFDETGRRLTFSGELLQIAIENIDQGVALVDADMKLVAWNQRYQQMFALPDAMVHVGTPIADLIAHNLRKSRIPEADIAQQVARRLEHMSAGRKHRMEREQHDGRIMRIVGNPTPGGGYVTSYTDITADRLAEQALEGKVMERTQQLSEANAALQEATRSKTRFLAAASHDLIQPLNAARLFASALGEEVVADARLTSLVHDLDASIASADRLIRTLLDISKLDGGGIQPCREPLAVNDLIVDLVREFSLQAHAKGLILRHVPSSVMVESDRALLASILRNLVSNAVRHTASGKVLIGVRRAGDQAMICVHDTGPGISKADQLRIFDEFQRVSADRNGLGLGLAIVRRTAMLLGHEVILHSRPGRGSLFAVRLPVLGHAPCNAAAPRSRLPSRSLGPARILVVDNDPAVLTAMTALLERWGLTAIAAANAAEARTLCAAAPDAVIMDYRLDEAISGDAAYQLLCTVWHRRPPAILLTAEAGAETQAAAGRMGAHRLLKPPAPAALRALLSDCLAHGQEEARQDNSLSATG
jgi:Na+/proline symporter/CheY-like chemotaxis protein/nitrogen-specific signal transduction histidine kinase